MQYGEFSEAWDKYMSDYEATAFDQDISGWFTGIHTLRVKKMDAMFHGATAFNSAVGDLQLLFQF